MMNLLTFQFIFIKIFHSLVWKTGRSGSESEINNFGSGSLRPNNFGGSGTLRNPAENTWQITQNSHLLTANTLPVHDSQHVTWKKNYRIQHCFIGRPSDFTVSADAGFELRTVAMIALAAKRCNHKAIDLIHTREDLIHSYTRSHTQHNTWRQTYDSQCQNTLQW